MNVEYREIEGFPGYRVGDDGSVWSCRVTYAGRSKPDQWHRLKPFANAVGQLHVSLCPGVCRRLVCRLVLHAFIGPCPDGMECCHNDGNPGNNHLENLRWDTHKANSLDMVRHGTSTRGVRSPFAKLTDQKVVELRARIAAGESASAVARDLGVSRKAVSAANQRQTWSHVA